MLHQKSGFSLRIDLILPNECFGKVVRCSTLLGYFILFVCNGKSFATAFLVYFKFTPVLF